MESKLPTAIAQRFCKMIVCAAAITIVGLIWGIASRDTVVIGLTIAISAAGALKAKTLYQTAQERNYEMIEGVLRDIRLNKIRKRTEVFCEDQKGTTHHLIIEGIHHFREGEAYRLYIQKITVDLTAVPDAILPGRTLLGYETLSI